MTISLTIGREHYTFGGKTLEDTRNACILLYNMKNRYSRVEELLITSQYGKVLGDYLNKLNQIFKI